MRIGEEGEADLAVLLAVVLEDKGVRNGLEYLREPVFIVPGALFALGALRGIFHQLFHARFISSALLLGERLAVDQQSAGELSLLGIDDVTVLGAFVVFTMDPVPPMRVVARICRQLMLDDFSQILVGVLR